MKLSELLSEYKEIHIPSSEDKLISALSLSSQDIPFDSLFFAYPGEKADGRNYIDQVIKKGAVAVLKECEHLKKAFQIEYSPLSSSVPIISIPHLQKEIGLIAQKFYDYPSKKMQIIGVTGTSGKTSVTHIITQILNHMGKNAYMMGTLGIGKPNESFFETGINTPDALSIQRYFRELNKKSCEVIVMEVSSHAIAQGRVQGLIFDAAIFLNLSQDHLDYHKTMEEYGAVKASLLIKNEIKQAIFNLDHAWSHDLYHLYKETKKNCHGFSIHSSRINLKNSPLFGEFNQQNLLAAVTCLLSLGYNEKEVLAALPFIRPIPGRLECIKQSGYACCVIDYAHKPDALEKVLLAVKAMTKGKLFCVFGCGGDRDKGKRPMMARIAETYADKVGITNDNPRTESPEKIFQDILSGFQNPSSVLVIPDRKQAIETMISMAKEEDTVLIAGKGHEDYQIIGHEKRYFSDRDLVKTILNNTIKSNDDL